MVESRREALQAYLARLDQKLEGAASELASLGMSKLPVQELSLPDDVDEVRWVVYLGTTLVGATVSAGAVASCQRCRAGGLHATRTW